MAKQPKVSVLIPCYNAEKYLIQCLDSVVNQTLKDIEIICINDGSTDNTLDILEQYAKKDARVKIINQKNGGMGRAYNNGLSNATGEYIAIVESDDWVNADAFEFLYNLANKNNADIAKADYIFFDNDSGVETSAWSIGLSKNLINRVFCPTEKNVNILWTGHPSIWTCLYSKKMLDDNNIKFAETPGATFQDMGFKVKTFVASKRFIYSPYVILHYRKHANNSDKNNGKVFAVSDVHDDVDKWIDENRPDLKKVSKIINQCRFANYSWNLWRLFGKPKNEFKKRFAKEFRKYYESDDLERAYFDNKTWLKLLGIIYPYNPVYPVLRAFITILSPIYKNRIRDGYMVYYLFNKIIVKKVKLPGWDYKI